MNTGKHAGDRDLAALGTRSRSQEELASEAKSDALSDAVRTWRRDGRQEGLSYGASEAR